MAASSIVVCPPASSQRLPMALRESGHTGEPCFSERLLPTEDCGSDAHYWAPPA